MPLFTLCAPFDAYLFYAMLLRLIYADAAMSLHYLRIIYYVYFHAADFRLTPPFLVFFILASACHFYAAAIFTLIDFSLLMPPRLSAPPDIFC